VTVRATGQRGVGNNVFRGGHRLSAAPLVLIGWAFAFAMMSALWLVQRA